MRDCHSPSSSSSTSLQSTNPPIRSFSGLHFYFLSTFRETLPKSPQLTPPPSFAATEKGKPFIPAEKVASAPPPPPRARQRCDLAHLQAAGRQRSGVICSAVGFLVAGAAAREFEGAHCSSITRRAKQMSPKESEFSPLCIWIDGRNSGAPKIVLVRYVRKY